MATGPISNRKWLLNLCVWQVGPRAPVWSIFWTGKASQWWRTAMHSSTISRGIWWSGLNYTCQLAECCKRQLNQGSFVLLYFRLFTFSDCTEFVLSVFSCTVLFVSISQVIGCGDRLRNDLYCVEWGVKLCSNQPSGHFGPPIPFWAPGPPSLPGLPMASYATGCDQVHCSGWDACRYL